MNKLNEELQRIVREKKEKNRKEILKLAING